MRVLLVEDDPAWSDVVADALGQAGHQVTAAANAAAARRALEMLPPDLAVVDIALEGDDGLVLCADLKEHQPDLPILICSASTRRADRLLSLKLADAFVAKPCDLEELVARVEVLARRPTAAPTTRDELRLGALVVHRRRAEALYGERAIGLTPAEHRLLVLLSERAGQVVPRSEAAERVHGHADATVGRALDMLAGRLRGKLRQLGDGAPLLNSVRGFGLQLILPD
jgi:two-component system phosphate regulon response regulator OmpR